MLSSLVLQALLCYGVDALLLKKITAQDARLQGLLILVPLISWPKILNQEVPAVENV